MYGLSFKVIEVFPLQYILQDFTLKQSKFMILKVCPTVTLTISMNTIPVRSRHAKYDQV